MNGPHEPIDFVLPWVDDSDPAWRAEMNRWRRRNDDAQADDSPERYRDWGTLRYWFRAVERFAPWVDRIHLLTWGHLPEWLDETHPRLHVVRHEEFIPDAYRPTFSSCPIELNMHRIEGLSERFVYFNDDTFLCRPVAPERFFRGGTPADMARLSIIPQERAGHNALECMRVINRRHAKRQVMAAAPGKWFSPRYPLADLLKSASLLPWSFFPGMKDHHMPQPFLKSTFNTLWEEEFVELMNRRAEELGLEDTHFVNPHGLSDDDHYTTAYDLAKLTCAALENETFERMVSTGTAVISDGRRTLYNHNRLLGSYEGCIGVKTGYTIATGRTLVTAARRDGMTLVAVTLNDRNDWADHAALLDYGFDNFFVQPLSPPSDMSVSVVGGKAESVAVRSAPSSAVLPEGSWITVTVLLPEFVYAPVEAGEVVGCVEYYCGGRLVASLPAVAAESVEIKRVSFFERLFS